MSLGVFQFYAASLSSDPQVKADFRKEMQRFLPPRIVAETVNNERFWDYLVSEILALMRCAKAHLEGNAHGGEAFRM